MDLSIIIVSWNTRALLQACLASIYHNPPGGQFEVLLVDNASSDGSAAMVHSQFPQVRVIENTSNQGFARANNQAIAQSAGRYVLLLNPDTEIKSGALDDLNKFMDQHTEAGAAGAHLINPDGSLQYSASPVPTLKSEFLRLFHLPGMREDGYYPMETWEVTQPRSTDILLGACLLVRRQALEQVGLLDENYFMYSEEVDLCWRLRKKGWILYWVPGAHVVHFGGQSTKQANEEMFLQLYKSKLLFFKKHYGVIAARLYKVLIGFAAIARMGMASIAGIKGPQQRQRYLATARNYRRLLISLPGI